MITASGIMKSYGGKTVLDGVDFAADGGESVAVIGRNGAGKSTLLSILAGHIRPDAGSVDTGGRGAAFCPQDNNLFEDLTVRDNILFWTRARGSRRNAGEPDPAELLGVHAYEAEKVGRLSGGMKKSVAIVCALTNNSPILILDEPFAGLDIFCKGEMLDALAKFRSLGKCIVYTAHGEDELRALNSRVCLLSRGKLCEQDGAAPGPADMLRRPG
ncbi:MAG: ABC transporter ATP-binding protein [Defluviitaleaceae bacterium]|nr:ABC transporter ATP-binding protein [Defluviitaleaceae bacterium]